MSSFPSFLSGPRLQTLISLLDDASFATSQHPFQAIRLELETKKTADFAFTIKVKNADAKAMEFESKSLRVEKVVAANSEGVINVRALKPGRYEFYDDFNEKARGALIVE